MFGKRAAGPVLEAPRPAPAAPPAVKAAPSAAAKPAPAAPGPEAKVAPKPAPRPRPTPTPAPAAEAADQHSDFYQSTKAAIFNALINTIDLSQLADDVAHLLGRALRVELGELTEVDGVDQGV